MADKIEEGGIADDAVLDAFGEAAADFADGEGFEGGDIGDDEARLMEGADEIFAGGVIDADFAADGGVDGGEEGGGDLDEGDSAEEGSGDVSGHIADDPPTECDDGCGTLYTGGEERVEGGDGGVGEGLCCSPAGMTWVMTR